MNFNRLFLKLVRFICNAFICKDLGVVDHQIGLKGSDKLGAGSHGSQVQRASSHTRLRAHDHCTSSSLIGGNGGVSPSLLHTSLEGATE